MPESLLRKDKPQFLKIITLILYFLKHPVHYLKKKPLTKNWEVWLICAQTFVTVLSFAI
jgi:hypothetical protein